MTTWTVEYQRQAGANHQGAMIALFLDPVDAGMLAIPGGEPPEDMHITLVYVTDDASSIDDETWMELERGIRNVASAQTPLSGRTTGVETFPTNDEGETPYYASVDIPGIQELRAQLVEAVRNAGIPFEEKFPQYVPHITLKYLKGEEQPPAPEMIDLNFDSVDLTKGDARTPILLGQRQMALAWRRER